MFRFIRLLLLLATASLIASCGGKNTPANWDPSAGTPADTVAPSQPGGLVATPMGTTGASLNWSASIDNVTVVSYVVIRNGAQVATSATTRYVDSGLAPATTYSYSVAALDEAGNLSQSSQTASVTTAAAPDTTPPSQPAGFTATAAGAVAANLSWNASTDNVGVTGYIVSRNGAQIATPAATSFADTGLAPATTYTYTVVARDAAGNQSAPASASVTTGTPADTTPPSQPAGLTGTPAGGTGANLSWSASTDDVAVTGYVVTRNGVQVATPAATSFADSGLNPATTYSYTVAARDAAGNRSTAASVSVTTADTLAPSTPTGLTGIASGSTGANLSWNASTDNVGVTGYIVTRNGVQVGTPVTPSFADTGLTAGTTYSYTVVARDAAGNRSTAASVSVTIADTLAPSTPTGLTGVASGSTGANLSWNASTDNVGVTGYIVTRNGVQVGTPVTPSFADTGLTAGTTYSYTVVARDAAGNRSTAASVSVTIADTLAPSTPTGLTGVASGSTGASLSWNASTDNVGVTGYIVTRNGVQIATPAATSFADTGLAPATTYTYTVVARDAAGNQSAPASASVTTGTPADTTPPSQPAGLTGTPAGGTGANLSWSASTDDVGVTGYIVTRNGVQIATPTTTSFADTGLTAGTTYSYTVVARDAAGNRSTAASVSVTTADTLAPSTPTGLTGVASGSTGANLSWNASTDNVGVTGYIVTRNGVQIATPTTTSFADTGLAPATIYTYTVVARDAAGNRSTAASVSVTIPDTVAPSQPGAFTVIATSSVQVSLSWTASTDNVGVIGYVVTRDGVQIATPTARTLADSGLTPSTTYVYSVVALDAAGNRSTAASATATTPAPPTTNGTVSLGWDAVTAPNLIGYRVYYGTASRTYVQPIGQGLISATNTFTAIGLIGGTRYFFAVTATDALGNESGLSNEVFADVP